MARPDSARLSPNCRLWFSASNASAANTVPGARRPRLAAMPSGSASSGSSSGRRVRASRPCNLAIALGRRDVARRAAAAPVPQLGQSQLAHRVAAGAIGRRHRGEILVDLAIGEAHRAHGAIVVVADDEALVRVRAAASSRRRRAPAGRAAAVMISSRCPSLRRTNTPRQRSAIGADVVRAQREAVLHADETVVLHARVPAGIHARCGLATW